MRRGQAGEGRAGCTSSCLPAEGRDKCPTPRPPTCLSSLTSSRKPFLPAPSPKPEAFRALGTSSRVCTSGGGWAGVCGVKEGQTRGGGRA